MILNICGRKFKSEEIVDIKIKDKEIHIFTTNDFYKLPFNSTDEIKDATLFIKCNSITLRDVYEALITLNTICEFFINSQTQCKECPLHRNHCILQEIPINWR